MASKSAFQGFPAEGIEFLRNLKENNDREWFNPRKNIFQEQVYAPMLELVSALHKEMLRFAPEYVGEPKKCIFRIYRDTRFAKDKTPYKTHIAAAFWRQGTGKNSAAGFYFSVSPEEIEIGGGLYGPDPDVLLSVRQYVADNTAAFRKTFETAAVKKLCGELWGESAARAPKGFAPDHPAIDLIRRKHFVLMKSAEPSLAATPKLMPEIVKCFETITPFIEFVNRPLNGNGKKTFVL